MKNHFEINFELRLLLFLLSFSYFMTDSIENLPDAESKSSAPSWTECVLQSRYNDVNILQSNMFATFHPRFISFCPLNWTQRIRSCISTCLYTCIWDLDRILMWKQQDKATKATKALEIEWRANQRLRTFKHEEAVYANHLT